MSSGRSARLPPTPNASNNKQWLPNSQTNTSTASAIGNLNEPNSNNLLYQYNNTTSVAANMSHHHHQHRHQMATTGIADNTPGVISTTDAAHDIVPGQTMDTMGSDFSVATSKVLESLSENERKMIIEVLNRDENIRQRDATRIM